VGRRDKCHSDHRSVLCYESFELLSVGGLTGKFNGRKLGGVLFTRRHNRTAVISCSNNRNGLDGCGPSIQIYV
jgi:hypothetical protein